MGGLACRRSRSGARSARRAGEASPFIEPGCPRSPLPSKTKISCEVIPSTLRGGRRWRAVSISGHQWASVAISGHQWASVAIEGAQR